MSQPIQSDGHDLRAIGFVHRIEKASEYYHVFGGLSNILIYRPITIVHTQGLEHPTPSCSTDRAEGRQRGYRGQTCNHTNLGYTWFRAHPAGATCVYESQLAYTPIAD